MRLLHTSDWHLGRTFHGVSLLDEQREVVERTVEIAAEHEVDLVVLAGDLYDRAIPPAVAVDLFDDAVVSLHATGAKVVAVCGNHDSAIRASVHDRIMTAAGVTIRGDVDRLSEPLVLDPADDGPPVAVYPVPYLEPALAGPHLGPTDGDSGDQSGDGEGDSSIQSRRLSHDEVTRLATDQIRADLAERGPVRSVVVAHTFVDGGTTSESERDLSVGNIDKVGLDAFAGFNYVALGHLHRSQDWDGSRVAYSGSPLPYSFSEEDHTKSVRIIELSSDGACTAETVALGVGRRLCTVRGTMQELLSESQWDDAEDARVRAFLTDRHLPTQAMARLRDRFPHAVELRHEPDTDDRPPEETAVGFHEVASPLDLTLQFWADQQGVDADQHEKALLEDALAAATREAGQ